jgi:hypothetical protein
VTVTTGVVAVTYYSKNNLNDELNRDTTIESFASNEETNSLTKIDIEENFEAPGEAEIARHFYLAKDFYDRNVYGRDYPVTTRDVQSPPQPDCIVFTGEYLAPNNSFDDYQDFLNQCNQYFDEGAVSGLIHEIRAEDYKGKMYSRFQYWGVGDVISGDYNVSVKEFTDEGEVLYYTVYVSFEDIAGEKVSLEINCDFVDTNWVFDTYDFYGLNRFN